MKIIGQQGEVRIYKLEDGEEMPKAKTEACETDQNGFFIVSHSEKGHHHVLCGGDVVEQTTEIPAGMRYLHAIVENPTAFKQLAANAHDDYMLEPGKYLFKVSREHNPFKGQAQRVAD